MGSVSHLFEFNQGCMARKVLTQQKHHGGLEASRNSLELPVETLQSYYVVGDNIPWWKSKKEKDQQPMSPFLAFTTKATRLLEEEQHLQLKKKEKDPLKPKQPMSAFLMFKNERRATLLAESKGVWEVAEITGEEWNNMTKNQKKPYEKVQLTLSLSLCATAISYFGNLQIAKQNKEKYLEEMEAYKQRKEKESASLKKEEEARSLAIAQEERENR